jgi:predicted AlkP superfamily pyrophosphatase or phosphodiesterase
MTDRTTFLIVSDHGFKAFTKQIKPNAALKAAGLDKQVFVLPEGGTAFVYMEPFSDAAKLVPLVRKALDGVEGIERIAGVEDYPGLGLPNPDRDPQFGHLLLAAKDGYSFSGATGGPVTAEVPQQGGSHGYLASESDMNPLFIASGYGVRKGVQLGTISNIDIAPTIAKLLGLTLPSAKGKTLALQ